MFDPKKIIKIVVHGWGGKTHIDEIFAKEYVDSGLDYNIIGVDWRDVEGPAQEQVVAVGEYVAHFLEVLVIDHDAEFDLLHPIGWSYGAHVVGNFQ